MNDELLWDLNKIGLGQVETHKGKSKTQIEKEMYAYMQKQQASSSMMKPETLW